MSMSFQPIQSQTVQLTASQPMTLRDGQMFHGTIKQLYPNQTAEVQVGNQKIIAKLEAPLKQGDTHVFQVTQTQPQTELKVVTNAGTQQQQMQQILQSMNLPKTPELQQALQQFMKAQLPISKEQLLQAESFLKSLPANVSVKEALTAMTKMLEGKMPFTQQVFQAMTQGAKTTGMVNTLQNLEQAILRDASVTPQTRENVLTQLQSIAKPFSEQAGGVYVGKLVEQLQSGNAAQKQEALTLLKQAGVLPQQATTTNWQQNGQTPSLAPTANAGQVVQALQQATPQQLQQQLPQLKQWVDQQQALTAPQKEALQQMISRFEQLPKTAQTAAIFAKQFDAQLVQSFSQNAQTQLFAQSGQLTAREQLATLIQQQPSPSTFTQMAQVASNQPQMQQLVLQTESFVQNNIDAKAIEQAMRSIMRDMGMSYEATMKNNDPQALASQLKPQLMELLQQQVLPATRDAAETMLARLNGMQLQSGDQGHQHQLIMQVPMQFLGKQTEATLQWNGRMKDDGKIDADYARILFYLDMTSIEQTMIDMQVQNRIVTVNVFNDNEVLQTLAKPLSIALKEGLAAHEYQLSGVFVKPFEVKQVKAPKVEERPTTGVDFRI